jgi:hypothetical protein
MNLHLTQQLCCCHCASIGSMARQAALPPAHPPDDQWGCTHNKQAGSPFTHTGSPGCNVENAPLHYNPNVLCIPTARGRARQGRQACQNEPLSTTAAVVVFGTVVAAARLRHLQLTGLVVKNAGIGGWWSISMHAWRCKCHVKCPSTERCNIPSACRSLQSLALSVPCCHTNRKRPGSDPEPTTPCSLIAGCRDTRRCMRCTHVQHG